MKATLTKYHPNKTEHTAITSRGAEIQVDLFVSASCVVLPDAVSRDEVDAVGQALVGVKLVLKDDCHFSRGAFCPDTGDAVFLEGRNPQEIADRVLS